MPLCARDREGWAAREGAAPWAPFAVHLRVAIHARALLRFTLAVLVRDFVRVTGIIIDHARSRHDARRVLPA